MKTVLTIIVTLPAICSVSSAQAQYGPFYCWGGPAYSSTAYEGACRGQAAWIQAYGQFLVHQAQAAYSWELARQKRVDNRIQTQCARRELEEVGRQERAKRRAEAAQQKAPVDRPPVARRPGRDELTEAGEIRWPAVLLAEPFQGARSRLDELFAARPAGPIGSQVALRTEIEAAARVLFLELRARIHEIPTNDYIGAKGFVQRLAYEARFPVGDRTLAQCDVVE
jgi:hypothetical protein